MPQLTCAGFNGSSNAVAFSFTALPLHEGRSLVSSCCSTTSTSSTAPSNIGQSCSIFGLQTLLLLVLAVLLLLLLLLQALQLQIGAAARTRQRMLPLLLLPAGSGGRRMCHWWC
jgi:hypothetical protein